MARILILIVLLIVYGSLYPWHFSNANLPESAFWMVFHARPTVIDRYSIRDTIVNVALYIPVGMAGFLVARRHLRNRALSFLAPILGGLILSWSIEAIQLFVPSRNTNFYDVVTNVIGATLGVLAGMAFESIAGPVQIGPFRKHIADRAALGLTFLWLGWLIFPLFPHTGLFLPGYKFRLFLTAAPLMTTVFLSGLGVWFTAGRLLERAGISHPARWLGLTVVAIPFQFFLVDRQPLPSDLIGAVAGFGLFAALPVRTARARCAHAGAFLGLLIWRGLAPFHWSPTAAPFSWLPFDGFLNTPWQAGILGLLSKAFIYGAAIWLLRTAGMRWSRATATVALVLGVIEGVQTHLPGRTPEVSDPMLAILLGFGLRVISQDV